MTQEQIEQAAVEYAEEIGTIDMPRGGGIVALQFDDDDNDSIDIVRHQLKLAFIAGAESRQAEIDQLDKELDIVHSCLTDLFERQYSNEGERTYRIQSCLSEIEKLKKHSK